MNLKGFERKRSWPNLEYYVGICWVKAEENPEKPQDGQCHEMNLNQAPYDHRVKMYYWSHFAQSQAVLLLLLYDMYVSCHRHFFLVLLLNQR